MKHSFTLFFLAVVLGLAAANLVHTQAHGTVPVHKARPAHIRFNSPQPTQEKFDIKFLSAKASYGNFSEAKFFEVPTADDFSIVFAVSATYGGALVRISGQEQETLKNCKQCIDLNFGSSGNTAVDVTYAGRRPNSQYIIPLYNGRVAGVDEYRYFWINFKYGELVVGFGKEIYRNTIVAYRDDALQQFFNWTSIEQGKSFLSGLKYVAFNADEQWVHFKDVSFGQSHIPRATLAAPVVTNPGVTYVQFHYPQMFEVSSKHFIMQFEVQGLGDMQLGWLTTYRFRMEDENGYEICLEEQYEHEHTGPRSLIQFGTGHGSKQLARTNVTGLMSASQFRPFWATLVDGVISFGRGRVVGQDVLMQTTGRVPDTGTDTLFFSTASYFLSNSIRVLRVKSKHGKVDIDFDARDDQGEDENTVTPITLKTGTGGEYPPFLGDGTCYNDKTCTDPKLPYRQEMPTVPTRNQWWHHGAFCGENSVQAIALHYGVYLSQKRVRMIAPDNKNPHYYKQSEDGYELTELNMAGTLLKLGFDINVWDTENAPEPQAQAYLRWLKRQLVQGYPVVWMVRYYEGDFFDHIESVWSIQSKHPLSDPTVYPDDVIANNLGVGNKRFYRRVDSLYDTNPVPTGFDKNGGNNCTLTTQECIFNNKDWGYAIKGLHDPHHRLIRTSIDVNDNGFEPTPPFVIPIQATVTVHGPLTVGWTYRIFTYDEIDSIPRDGNYEQSDFVNMHQFVATASTYTWQDPQMFLSNSTVYYLTVEEAGKVNLDESDEDEADEAESTHVATQHSHHHAEHHHHHTHRSLQPYLRLHHGEHAEHEDAWAKRGGRAGKLPQTESPETSSHPAVRNHVPKATASPKPKPTTAHGQPTYVGCYADANAFHAVPNYRGKVGPFIKAGRTGSALAQCTAQAAKFRDNVLALQGDKCFTGRNPDYALYGEPLDKTQCTPLGGKSTNQVYRLD